MRQEARQVDSPWCTLPEPAQPIHTIGQGCRDRAQGEHPSYEGVPTEIGSVQRSVDPLGRRLDPEPVALAYIPPGHEVVDQHGCMSAGARCTEGAAFNLLLPPSKNRFGRRVRPA